MSEVNLKTSPVERVKKLEPVVVEGSSVHPDVLTPDIKVLHVYRTYYPDTQGGLEEVIRQICMNSRGLGIKSKVLMLTSETGRKVVRLPEAQVYRSKLSFEVASCGVSLEAFGMFKKLADWADLIHYHFPWPFADVLHFASRINKPTVLTYHSDIVRQRVLGAIYFPLMHKFLDAMDSIVCTSPNYFATSEVLARHSSNVDIIPIGINESSYSEPTEEQLAEVRDEFGEDFFLFVGVLRYYKGLHILLDAVKGAPYKVVVAGSGPTEKELIKQARVHGINNIVFTGYVPNWKKNAMFKLCRGVVFPSYLRAEAFGVTLLEGSMFGKPLISTEVGSGTSHVNVHDQTGIVIPPGSARAMRQAMDRLWAHPDLAEHMGKKARKRYEQLFTGELMGIRYAHVYREVASASQRQSQ